MIKEAGKVVLISSDRNLNQALADQLIKGGLDIVTA